VQPGETLYGIARRYAVTVNELAEINGLTNMSYLHPDDELVIPTLGQYPTPTMPPSDILHVVQAGEGLSGIAERYGVDEERIRQANGMGPEDKVARGDRLIIPLNPTPAPTATRTPTATPTPGPPYLAPHLLYPPEGAILRGKDEVAMLQWASVGILKEGEFYALSLRYLGERPGNQPSETTVHTRTTSWRIPPEWYPGEGAVETGFTWTVEVVRQEDESTPLTILSSPGYVRRLEWQ
jgi:LysM repeat protein